MILFVRGSALKNCGVTTIDCQKEDMRGSLHKLEPSTKPSPAGYYQDDTNTKAETVNAFQRQKARHLTDAPLPPAWKLSRSQVPDPSGAPLGGRALKSNRIVVHVLALTAVLIADSGMVAL